MEQARRIGALPANVIGNVFLCLALSPALLRPTSKATATIRKMTTDTVEGEWGGWGDFGNANHEIIYT